MARAPEQAVLEALFAFMLGFFDYFNNEQLLKRVPNLVSGL